MNPFKPLVQFCEEFYVQKISIKISISKPYLNISLAKENLDDIET